MKSITLTKEPKDKELEEYIASYYQCMGYYVEKNIVERDIDEVLELDIITTDYQEKCPKVKLIEVKSGKWGFPDIFKLKGWLTYLKINEGIFITSTSKGEGSDSFYNQKTSNIGIDLIIIHDLEKCDQYICNGDYQVAINSIDISIWRYTYWIEREIFKDLTTKRKSIKDVSRYQTLWDYYNNINNIIFFTENLLDRIILLYDEYKKHPHLSAMCGNEIVSNNFSGEEIPYSVFQKTYYDCEKSDINISTYLEHRARLAIIKNIVDFICLKKTNTNSKKVCEENYLDFDDICLVSSKYSQLPQEFRDKIDLITNHKYLHRYSIFWQWFLWFFGGFILNDYREQEYDLLSKKTGIPVEEIDSALSIYDILFPITNGWFITQARTSIKKIKMFPVPIYGNGADYRKRIYTTSNKYDELNITGDFSLSDIIKWHNNTVNLLL